MNAKRRLLPEGVELAPFLPVAYYDRHMDCIRVFTHDRSITEHRLSEVFTVYECNHRGPFDPQYVGFAIKGVRHLFHQAGLQLEGVHRLADLISELVSRRPGSISAILRLIMAQHQTVGDLRVDLSQAA